MKCICVFFISVIFATICVSLTSGYSLTSGALINDPVDQCKNEFDKACMSCNFVGTCRLVNNSFVIIKTAECLNGDVCGVKNDLAACHTLTQAESPVCLCADSKTCTNDPYDSTSYVVCGDPISYGTCKQSEAFNFDTCQCESRCSSCGLSPGPDTGDCGSYYDCGSGDWVAKTCPAGQCFNADKCVCEDLSCPACGYAPYPGDLTQFIYCDNGQHEVGRCFEGGYFDELNCVCIGIDYTTTTTGSAAPITTTPATTTTTTPEVVTTTQAPETKPPTNPSTNTEAQTNPPTTTEAPNTTKEPTTTLGTTTEAPDLCSYCGFYEFTGDCNKYYRCHPGSEPTVEQCPEQLCFNPVTCNCES